MKVFPSGRRWLSVGLLAMLFALVSFSMMPLLTATLKGTRPDGVATVPLAPAPELESRAMGYRSVLDREPDNQNALRGLLEIRLQQGDLEGAIAPLERLAGLNPRQSDYLFLLARTKEQVGDTEGALGTFRALLASEPGNFKALQGLADLLSSQGRSVEAIAAVKESLERALASSAAPGAPAAALDVVTAEMLLGKLYFDRKEYAAALEAYERARGVDEKDFRPLLGKAIVLQEQGRIEAARPLFQEALTLAPARYHQDIQTLAATRPPTAPDGDNPTPTPTDR